MKKTTDQQDEDKAPVGENPNPDHKAEARKQEGKTFQRKGTEKKG